MRDGKLWIDIVLHVLLYICMYTEHMYVFPTIFSLELLHCTWLNKISTSEKQAAIVHSNFRFIIQQGKIHRFQQKIFASHIVNLRRQCLAK